jgi:ankyrin repeat protein
MKLFKRIFGKKVDEQLQSEIQIDGISESEDFEFEYESTLHEACASGNPVLVRQVLSKPHEINSRSNWASGFTPLLTCVAGTDSLERQEIIKLLHAAGADLNLKDTEKGLTPLQYTALRNKPLCMKALISCGADIHITEGNGATALHGAVYHGNLEVIKILIESGANPYLKDNMGNTPVSLAERTNNEMILKLLKTSANENIVPVYHEKLNDLNSVEDLIQEEDEELRWDFLDAAKDNDIESVELLLDLGANINCTTDDNWTALLEAALHGPEMSELLLSHGANPNIASDNGYTPLMRAAGHGNIKVVELLLEAGSNPSLVDDRGASAYQFAIEGKYFAVAELIEKFKN